MIYYVLTLFPQAIENGVNYSILKRAADDGIISVKCVDIRNFAVNKHGQVDDYPYGGGAGMVLMPDPVYDAYMSVKPYIGDKTKVIYMSPQGKPFNQRKAEELAKEKELVLLCGHYEGIDERVLEEIVTEEISIGDFVLTGGELPAIAVIDAVTRLIPGTLKAESYENESFSDGLLEYPQYTRPFDFHGKNPPEVLLSGHHKNIEEWRRQQSIYRTAQKRPDIQHMNF